MEGLRPFRGQGVQAELNLDLSLKLMKMPASRHREERGWPGRLPLGAEAPLHKTHPEEKRTGQCDHSPALQTHLEKLGRKDQVAIFRSRNWGDFSFSF